MCRFVFMFSLFCSYNSLRFFICVMPLFLLFICWLHHRNLLFTCYGSCCVRVFVAVVIVSFTNLVRELSLFVLSLTLCSSLVSTKRKRYSFVAWFLERLPTVRDFCGKYCQQQLTSAACCSFRSPCLLRHQHDHDVCTSRTSGSFLPRVKHYFVHVTIMQWSIASTGNNDH